MRQIVLGSALIVWGGAVVIARLTGLSQVHGAGAYRAGQEAGWLLGLLILIAGAFAVRSGVRAVRERKRS